MKNSMFMSCTAALVNAASAFAGGTITDGSASLTLDTPVFSSDGDDTSFVITQGGPNQLSKFTWYYRSPGSGGITKFGWFDTPVETYSGNRADIVYTNAGASGEEFDAHFTIVLKHGPNANQPRLECTLQFTNTSSKTSVYQIFNMFDPDMGGSPKPSFLERLSYDNSGIQPGGPGPDGLGYQPQTDRGFTRNSVRTGPQPSNIPANGNIWMYAATFLNPSITDTATIYATGCAGYQMGATQTLRTLLSGGTGVLNNNPLGQAGSLNSAGAFQWVRTVAPGESFEASVTIGMNQLVPACYANCDGEWVRGQLNVLSAADFTCFLSKFQSGDEYANCDGSTAAPVLSVSDFVCFLNAFRGGCHMPDPNG